MNRSSASDSVLPGWARAADGLTVVLALAALYVTVFGGIRIGAVFSMSTPWRALGGLIIICGLRHYLVRTPAIHQRAWNWLRPAMQQVAHVVMHARQSRPGRVAARWWQWSRSVYERWLPARARRALAGPQPVQRENPSAARFEAFHVVGLWGIAVAQPIFDLLGRSPEFFVAHDTRPGDLLALTVLLCLAGPVACLVVIHLVGRLGGAGWRRRAAAVAIGVLTGAVALAAFKPLAGWPGGFLGGLAAITAVAAAAAYIRLAPVRMFATFLSPAVVVVPALFLLNPGVARLLVPPDDAGAFGGVTFTTTPPVVVVVFDQFQLAALLDQDGNIDRTTFPHFAALAEDATWYRNGSAVGGHTTFALPAILTGRFPSPDRLPTAADHPANLFTLLGGRYRLHVQEPLTDLCPDALCPPEPAGAAAWLAGVLSDLAVVYLTVVLPADLAAGLPPVTQSWNDFAAAAESETFMDRWRAARVDDRRETVTGFIESISAASDPTLHFLHVLLPHEPWLYLPSGQQFTFDTHSIGLSNGKWVDDRWAAALNYQRYLLQIGSVDALLGTLVARLRDVGIYDDALIVVTADHGASLRPGFSFRRPDESSFVDIAAVPMFIKRPRQRRGEVVDDNVEVIDILPTLAGELGVGLPWATDGSNAFDRAHAPRASKVLFVDGARNRVEAPGDLRDALMQGVARKFALFESGDPLDVPTPDGRYGDLVGRAADQLRAGQPAAIEVVVDGLPLLRDVNPDGGFIPAHITGAVADLPDGSPAPVLAIAINGVVAAVTRPYSFRVFGRRAAWEAIVDPRWFERGANTLEVFEVRPGGGHGVFTLVATVGGLAADPWPNLVRNEEAQALGVGLSGVYGTEWAGNRAFRWTRGDARLLVPFDPEQRPSELDVDVLMTGGPKRLQIRVDGCALFDQTISGRWTATFELESCRLSSPDLEIELLSDTHAPETSDSRTLGVAVSRVRLRGVAPTP